jgi:arylformamidase
MAIYKNYDKTALDKQYNNRAMVPNFADIVQNWERQSEALRQRATHHAGIAYGSGVREYLDIFPGGKAEAPLHVFFHGGYWQGMQSNVFHFIADGFLTRGITTILVNYPLAPAATMAEIIDACRRAVVWIYRHAAEYGANPHKIYISGHSAGGHLVAMLLATAWADWDDDLPADLIKGGCAISGLFNLIPIQRSYVNDNIGINEAMARQYSPDFLAPATISPLIISVGEAESAEYHAQSEELATTWTEKGAAIQTLTIAGANHFTILDALVQPEGVLHRAILAQMA